MLGSFASHPTIDDVEAQFATDVEQPKAGLLQTTCEFSEICLIVVGTSRHPSVLARRGEWMKLSELYRYNMDQALLWAGLRRGKSPVVQEDFIARQRSFQCAADSLAHCIAAFGDVEAEQLDVAAARLVKVGFNQMGNPYRRGLDLIEQMHARPESPASSA